MSSKRQVPCNSNKGQGLGLSRPSTAFALELMRFLTALEVIGRLQEATRDGGFLTRSLLGYCGLLAVIPLYYLRRLSADAIMRSSVQWRPIYYVDPTPDSSDPRTRLSISRREGEARPTLAIVGSYHLAIVQFQNLVGNVAASSPRSGPDPSFDRESDLTCPASQQAGWMWPDFSESLCSNRKRTENLYCAGWKRSRSLPLFGLQGSFPGVFSAADPTIHSTQVSSLPFAQQPVQRAVDEASSLERRDLIHHQCPTRPVFLD